MNKEDCIELCHVETEYFVANLEQGGDYLNEILYYPNRGVVYVTYKNQYNSGKKEKTRIFPINAIIQMRVK